MAILVKIHWYLLSYLLKEKYDVSRADNFVKNWRNMTIGDPKLDLHNTNAHTKFGENPFIFTQVITRIFKLSNAQADLGRRCLFTVSINKNSHNYFLLSHNNFGKLRTDGRLYDRRPGGRTDTQTANLKP